MGNPTCLYCDGVLKDRRYRVCDAHKDHHRKVKARKQRVEYNRKRGVDYDGRICIDCGASIADRTARAKRCLECVKAEHRREARETKAKRYGPKVERRCLYCGTEIGVEYRRDKKFCSRKCIDHYRSKYVDRTEYNKRTRSRRAEYTRQWRKLNPASTRSSKYKRRVRELQGVLSERDWSRTLNRFDHRCAYCGRKGRMTVDHVVPLSRGGRNAVGNVLPACRQCNSSKHARFLSEWRLDRHRRSAA